MFFTTIWQLHAPFAIFTIVILWMSNSIVPNTIVLVDRDLNSLSPTSLFNEANSPGHASFELDMLKSRKSIYPLNRDLREDSKSALTSVLDVLRQLTVHASQYCPLGSTITNIRAKVATHWMNSRNNQNAENNKNFNNFMAESPITLSKFGQSPSHLQRSQSHFHLELLRQNEMVLSSSQILELQDDQRWYQLIGCHFQVWTIC
jgi:hypothetical protein